MKLITSLILLTLANSHAQSSEPKETDINRVKREIQAMGGTVEKFQHSSSPKDYFYMITIPDATDGTLKKLPKIAFPCGLCLQDSEVTDRGMKHLLKLKPLVYLDLNCTKISDYGMKKVVKLKNLESLYLADTKVTDAGIKNIGQLKHLSSLYLCLTKVSDSGLKSISKLKCLFHLYVRKTQVTKKGAAQFKEKHPCSIDLVGGGNLLPFIPVGPENGIR